MQVESVAIGRVRPYPGNPRRNTAAVAKVAASIREFGFRQPIVVDEDLVVIAGHTRLQAAQSLALAEVPVHVARGLTPAQVRAYRLADNRVGEEAEWDVGKLAEELAALQGEGFNLGVTGFDAGELAEILATIGADQPRDPDDAPALEAAARSALGDVWILGHHRVTCGSATEKASLDRALGGAAADVVWTDPPYNVAYSSKAGAIANDDLADDEFLAFLSAVFEGVAAVLRPGGGIYVAHADAGETGVAFRRAFLDAGLKLAACLIWRKDALVLGRSDYQWIHEPILYGWRPGAAHRWFGGRKQRSLIDLDDSPFAPMPDGRYQIRVGDRVLIVSGDVEVEEVAATVITEARPKKSALHPTMKPVALIERMLANSARPGDLVLDPFGGSGSTLMAAERLAMRAALVELDPCYCDVIVRRWQEYSGRRATREADGRAFDDVVPRPTARAA